MPSSNPKLTEIFHLAIALNESERRAFIERACDGDDDLREDVERLIESHHTAKSFSNTPAYERSGQTIVQR